MIGSFFDGGYDGGMDFAALPKTVPVPLFSSTKLGSITGKTGEVFTLVIGLDERMVAELKQKSLDRSDTDLQENTSDYQRFGEGSYEEWYSKDRTPFALIHEKTGALAALIWYGPKPLGRKSLKHLSEAERREDERLMDAGNWHTIVFRAYAPFRGQGLMKPFALATMEIYHHYFPQARIWAGINATNAASIALAEKIGLHKEESVSDERWVAMVSD